MICETCGAEPGELVPCPCGLGPECPVVLGVCVACYRTIAGNAIDRRRQHAHNVIPFLPKPRRYDHASS